MLIDQHDAVLVLEHEIGATQLHQRRHVHDRRRGDGGGRRRRRFFLVALEKTVVGRLSACFLMCFRFTFIRFL
jgi:hypothetical protein